MRKLVAAMALLSFGSVFSQEIEWGPLMKASTQIQHILPVQGSTFFTARWSLGGLVGTHFLSHHEHFEVDAQEKIVNKADGSMATLNDIVSFNSKVIVFLTDKRDGLNKLYMQPYGTDCLPEGDAVELAEYQIPKGWNKSGYFNVLQSRNQQFFCVEYSIPASKEGSERFGYKVLNASFETISEGEYESPYDPNQSDVSNRYLSNTGDYFMAVKVYNVNSRGRVRDYSSLEKFVLMHVTAEGLDQMELNLDNKRISDVTFSSDNNSLMTFTGLYGQGSTSAKGVFYFQVDFKEHEILNQGFSEFGNDFITQGWSNSAKKRADKREAQGKGAPLLYDYVIRDNTTLPDGSMIGMIEQYFVQVVYNYANSQVGMYGSMGSGVNNMRPTYYYYYNDVITYKVSPTGEFVWLQKIPKSQVTVNDNGYYSSVADYVTNDKLVVLFNDNLKNYDDSGNFLPFSNSHSLQSARFTKKTNCVARVELDLTTGEMNRKTYFGRSEAGAIAIPKLFQIDYNNHEMLMVLRMNKKEKFGLIRFGE